MGRRRKKEPKRNTLCLRLTDRQLELLQRYVDFKEYESEVDALRKMVDGLEDWLARQSAKRDIAGSPGRPPDTSVRTDVSRGDVRGSDVARPSQGLGEDDSADRSVGDFAGRPSVGLPKPNWNDGTED